MRKYPSAQLATLVDAPPEGERWVHEIKFDGYRLLGFLAGGEIALRTRNGLDWTVKLPSVTAAIGRLKAEDAVLDMEAVVLDEHSKSVSRRSKMHSVKVAIATASSRTRSTCFIWTARISWA